MGLFGPSCKKLSVRDSLDATFGKMSPRRAWDLRHDIDRGRICKSSLRVGDRENIDLCARREHPRDPFNRNRR